MDVTQERLNQLLTFSMDFAKEMLEENGDFYPFGATVSEEGKLAADPGHEGDGEPEAQDVYRVIFERFSTGRPAEALAAALVANVTIPDEFEAPAKDGVRVHLESKGYARFIYVPYEIVSADAREVRLHDPFAVEISPSFFTA
ncbi:MAG TPA: hypothetical protein VM621_07095 [Luteibacter sp.]|uniref:hypothetical protein n=1 Tax=Luteibacter sp. TaxID=1886636 RepID=UPI002C42D530|nr:hypothetical protein [Luteibacter sp.]HVI54803.1 hypothetical protein [Luteibacter sp.]